MFSTPECMTLREVRLHTLVAFHVFVRFQTPIEYYEEYQAYLYKRNISLRSNVTAFAYDGIWTIAMAINRSVAALRQKGLRLEDFTYQHLNITRVLVSVMENLQFQGVTVSFTLYKKIQSISYL